MIKKLQKKFIIIAMMATIVVTCSIYAIIVLANYIVMNRQFNELLDLISENDGEIPEYQQRNDDLSGFITQETEFSTRYFIVKIDNEGNIIETNMQHIVTVEQGDVQEILQQILESDKELGYYNNFKYKITEKDDGKLIVFLDCTMQLNNFKSSTEKSIMIIIIGIVIVFVIIFIMSKKILSPIIKNIEKQKQFVTNAGHELKTPIAIIMANADVLEMTSKENNELVQSIKKQTKRLDTLTKSLLNLANVEERKIEINYTEISLTEMIQEEISQFKALAQNKEIIYDSGQDIRMKADSNSIKQLITILLDNAIKYTPDNGKIVIKVEKQKENIKMQFSNDCENIASIDTDKIFDRFYREDKSRSKTIEGFGIGLSVAKGIVELHDGKITAEIDKENRICFTILF